MTMSCPSVHELTPDDMKCTVGASCPSVHGAPGDKLVIVGKRTNAFPAIPVGEDEHIIIVDRALLANVFQVPGFDRAQLTAPEPYEPVEPYAKPDVIGIT